MRVSLNFKHYAFLICFTLNHYSARAQWRQSQSALYNVAVNNDDRQFKFYEMSESAMKIFCNMNNRHRFKRLLEPILVPRIVGTETHREVAGHLSRILSAAGFTIEFDQFEDETPHGTKSFKNIVATYDVNIPKRLVLACHYDSKILKGEVFIGAVDSAVPCAILLEMASSLGPLLANRKRKDITLQLIFFDGEEALEEWSADDSLYGARHLAAKWKREFFSDTHQSSFEIKHEIDRIDLFVLLDLLGTADPLFYNFKNYSSANAFWKLLTIERSLKQMVCLHDMRPMFQARTVSSRVEDDHIPFLEHGVPILHLIPIPFPYVWHKVSDNANALNYETVDNLISILRVFVASYLGLVP